MKRFNYLFSFLVVSIVFVPIDSSANIVSAEELAKRLNLMPGYKAMAQWERIFKSKRKMKRYKIDILSSDERKKLERYLINHAIDSDYPTVAGEF